MWRAVFQYYGIVGTTRTEWSREKRAETHIAKNAISFKVIENRHTPILICIMCAVLYYMRAYTVQSATLIAVRATSNLSCYKRCSFFPLDLLIHTHTHTQTRSFSISNAWIAHMFYFRYVCMCNVYASIYAIFDVHTFYQRVKNKTA